MTGSAGLLVGRAAVVMLVGLAANLALAKLLSPRDFGLVALGTVLLAFGGYLSDAGLGAGLIRRPEPPTRRELEVVSGLQLGVTVALVGAAMLVATAVGRDGWVVVVMALSLPVTMLKVPTMIVLERSIDYRLIAAVDVIEALGFYVIAVAAAALGGGVWGFAAAVVARAVLGVVVISVRGPLGVVRPRWAWREARALGRFAVIFQASRVVGLVRDQCVNVAIAGILGIAALGVWNLAWRVLQIPMLVFANLNRVGFPAMARLMESGEGPAPVLERASAVLTVLSATIAVAIVGFAPALPGIVGDAWADVANVLLWAGITLIFALPLITTLSAYLFAADAAGAVLGAALVSAVVWFAVMLPLLSPLGPVAAAVGWLVGAVAQNVLLVVQATRRSGAALAASVVPPIAAGVAAAAVGWYTADAAGGTVAAGLAGVLAGEALLATVLVLMRRTVLQDTRRLARQTLGSLRPGLRGGG